MKITNHVVHRVEVDPKTIWLFLEIETDAGISGLGEALVPGRGDLASVALDQAARALHGRDVLEASVGPAPLADDQATGLLEATVRSAVDQALWDLRARVAGLPLGRMLGPALRNRLRLYANINRGTRERSPEGFAARAADARGDGFDAVKIAPFDGVTRANVHRPDGRGQLRTGLDRIRAVREAIGPDAMLMIDCHCRLDLASALHVLDATAGLRLDWFEDVLPYHDLDGWTRLKAVSHAPLAGGETARGTRDLLPFLERGVLDVLMPDIRFFGGVTELHALAPLAEQHQVLIAPHNPRGPVGTLASAHVMASCPGFYMLEYQWRECDWREALCAGAEHIRDGMLELDATPGIGMSLARDVVDAHRAR